MGPVGPAVTLPVVLRCIVRKFCFTLTSSPDRLRFDEIRKSYAKA